MKVLKKNISGEVTWQYEGVVLHAEENAVTLEALFNRDDMPFMDVVFKRNDRFVETFYSDRWYNIFEIYDRDDGNFKGWYCNISRPAVIENDSVSWILFSLVGFANILAAQEKRQTALQILGLCMHHPETNSDTHRDIQLVIEDLRKIRSDDIETGLETGRSLDLNKTVLMALGG